MKLTFVTVILTSNEFEKLFAGDPHKIGFSHRDIEKGLIHAHFNPNSNNAAASKKYLQKALRPIIGFQSMKSMTTLYGRG